MSTNFPELSSNSTLFYYEADGDQTRGKYCLDLMMIYILVFMFVLAMQNKYLPTIPLYHLASSEHLKPHIGDCFVRNESILGQPDLPGVENSPSWEISLKCHKWHIL